MLRGMNNMSVKLSARRITALVISVLLLCGMVPVWPGAVSVSAASEIATVKVDGGAAKSYSSLEKLVDDVDDLNKKNIVIDMKSDWNAAKSDDFDRELIIPADSTATFNMHGRVFSRNNSWDSGDECIDGELITVKPGAVLIVNGGSEDSEKEREHSLIPIHTSCGKNARATGRTTIKGGLLCGGASTNGSGGIHVKEGASVTLNDLTIAGCRSEANDYWFIGGYGGGVYLSDDDARLKMNNSTITGCYAEYTGGGICTSGDDNISIELNNSVIDSNYAYEEGGGIGLRGEQNSVRGDGKSTVSNNQCNEEGGGVYINDEKEAVTNLQLIGNKAETGGAVYTDKENTTLSSLVVKDNHASDKGGGLYIWNDLTEVSSCEITGNRSAAGGGGVYVASGVDVDFKVGGKTIIRDNRTDAGKDHGNNFYMSDDDPEDSRVMFSLASGSDVRVRYYATKGKDMIMVTMGKSGDTIKSTDCTRFLTSENDGYYFDFLTPASQRKIVLRKGSKEKIPDPTVVKASEAAPVKAGTVTAGGKTFDKIRGYFTHQKSDSSTGDEDRNTVFYYSDGLFYGSSDAPQYEFNQHLATTSLSLAFAAMYLERKDPLKHGNGYYNKHAAGRQFLADIGCPDYNIYVNDSMVSKPGTDSIGVIIGSKELTDSSGQKTGDILIPVTFRGGGYELEWASNMTLNTAKDMAPTKEAYGFSSAANQALIEIDKYLDKYDLREKFEDGRVKFWVCGYSRAGATANLTSRRLVDKIAKECKGASKSQVFGYTCEAPKGGTDEAETPGNDYTCIHNLINTADIVPLVAPEEMGFKRYGVDHYIPGDEAGAVSVKSKSVSRGGEQGVTSVTTRSDNTAMRTKGAKENDAESRAYISQRNKMVEQLQLIDSGMTFDDYFHPMCLVLPSKDIKEVGTYDGTRVEDFLVDFMRLAQEGTGKDSWSEAIPNRDVFAKEPYKLNKKEYSTIQESLQDLMSLVFGMSSEDKGTFTSRAKTILNSFEDFSLNTDEKTMLRFYQEVIGMWYHRTDAEKEDWCTFLWEKLKDTEALDVLSDSQKADLKRDWPTIANLAFRLLDADDHSWPGKDGRSWAAGSDNTKMYLITLATHADYILANHYPEINLAWARTYDDWYQGETKEYSVAAPETVKSPRVTVKDGDKTIELTDTTPAFLTGDQRIIVDNEDINGEAVYYDLYETTGGWYVKEVLARNSIYRGGVDLSTKGEAIRYFTLAVRDMSYGVSSAARDYHIKVSNIRHKVSYLVKDESGNDKTIEAAYESGQTVTAQATIPEGMYFDRWTVDKTDENGNVIKKDITARILGDGAGDPAAVFVMPEPDDVSDSGYGLRFTASYGSKINTVTFDTPVLPGVGGEHLPETCWISYGSPGTSKGALYKPTWTYKDSEGNICPAPSSRLPYNDTVYNETVYIATINMQPDKANGAVFDSEVKVEIGNYFDPPTAIKDKVKKNEADGSITIYIECPPTLRKKTDSERYDRPDSPLRFRVGAWDLNLNDYDEDAGITDYSAVPGSTVDITAPDVPGELFKKWDLKETEITLAEQEGNDLTNRTITVNIPDELDHEKNLINAEYVPVVTKIEVNMYDENGAYFSPAAGSGGPARIEAFGTVENTYEIDPENLEITWLPEKGEDGDFAPASKYQAVVRLRSDLNGTAATVRARRKGSGDDFVPVTLEFNAADNIEVRFNGTSDETVSVDVDDMSLTKVFPDTRFMLGGPKTVTVGDVTGVPHGASADDVKNALQQTATLYLKYNMSRDVPIVWESAVPDKDKDSLEEIVWTVSGGLVIPSDITEPVSTAVTAKVTVDAAETAQSPQASLASGTYRADQMITLDIREAGGTTYYTTDGSEPGRDSMKYTDGQVIMFRRDDIKPDENGVRKMTIKAFTAREGKRDSGVSTYEYVFDNNIPVPTGHNYEYNSLQQTGVDASRFYTVTEVSEGASVSDTGEVTAVDAGKYTVKLRLADESYKWIITDEDQDEEKEAEQSGLSETGDESEVKTTTEEQTVTFEIYHTAIRYADVSNVKNKTYTGKAVKQDPKVTLRVFGVTLEEGKDYTISYDNNVKPGIATMTIKGIGNMSGERSCRFNITVKGKLRSAKAKKGRKALIRWKKAPKATGWQIRYSTNKKFRKAVKKVTVKKGKATKKTIKKLKAGKTYYVQIRSYNKVIDKETGKQRTIYGSWSAKKKFKAKK